MAISLGSETLSGEERSVSVTRHTPSRDTSAESLAAVQLVITRERISRRNDGAVAHRTAITPEYQFSYAQLTASPSVAAYVEACGAESLLELMQREADLYDGLIAERNAAQAP